MRRSEAEEVIDLVKKGSAGGEILKMEFVKRVCELVMADMEERHAAEVAELQAKVIDLEDYSRRILKESAELEADKAEQDKAEPKPDKAAGEKPKRKRKVADIAMKKCVVCGSEFKPGSNSAKYCDSCKKDKKRDQNKICERNRQARIREEKKANRAEAEVFEADAIANEASGVEALARELAGMD